MPPRRSSRAPSTKPPSKPAPKAVQAAAKPTSKKPQTEAKVNGTAAKRAASPERTDAPPAKRSRASSKSESAATAEAAQRPARAKPASKTAAAKPASRKASAKPASKAATNGRLPNQLPSPNPLPPPQSKPYFNPLPSIPAHERPGLVLFAWGAGNFGQFGMGPDVLHEVPKPKRSVWSEEQSAAGKFGEKDAGLETASAGGLHTLLVDEKGTVWTCGVNDEAALGRETVNIPDPENPGQFLDVDDLTSYPHPLQSLVDENFRTVQTVAGDSISAAVSSDGELRVWGSFRANEGALGFADGLKNQYKPVSPGLQLYHKPGDTEKVVSVANGSNHLLVLTTHGNVFAWGASEQGQLGRKVLERRKIHGTVPEKITLGTRARKAVVVGAGSYHSFAVDEQGDVWGWGLNTMGQTGTGYTSTLDDIVQTPQKVGGLSKDELGGDVVVEIIGGTHHTLFRTRAGKVYGVGRCNAGQLGLAEEDPAFKDRFDPDFVTVPALVTFPDADDPIVQISCGTHNSAAVTEGGALYSWGQGLQGELGVPEEEVRTPRIIVKKEGGSWHTVSVSCGGQHTLALLRKKV
ncbi:hypothetical protein H1R20_g5505, partial [Candolleomyces eurysporus]